MRGLHLALALSVVLNLFLAGALLAGAWSLRGGGHMIAAGSLRIAGAELPAAERRPFRTALRETRRSMHATIVAARTARAEAATSLRAPVLDQAATIAALDRARLADMAVRGAVERRAVAYAATLPAPDRAKLADAMRRRAEKSRPAAE